MKTTIILIGNIGSGKTTIAQKLVKKGFIVVSRDSLRYGLGAGKYIFNQKYEKAIKKATFYLFSKLLDTGVNIIVDEVNFSKETRKRYIRKAKQKEYQVIGIIMPIIPREECINRRMKNPHGQPNRRTWRYVWDMFNSIYDEPTLKEGFKKLIRKKQ
jgi:predicted kinase